jgi:hypothetical protein
MFKKLFYVFAFVALFDIYFSLVLSQKWDWAGYDVLTNWLRKLDELRGGRFFGKVDRGYRFCRLCAYGAALVVGSLCVAGNLNARKQKYSD